VTERAQPPGRGARKEPPFWMLVVASAAPKRRMHIWSFCLGELPWTSGLAWLLIGRHDGQPIRSGGQCVQGDRHCPHGCRDGGYRATLERALNSPRCEYLPPVTSLRQVWRNHRLELLINHSLRQVTADIRSSLLR
jgi:hypothetical protein